MLTDSEKQRYARHFSIPEFGVAGQERLRAAKVLVVGAGGLGSPVLAYLAAAGVGEIGIVDADRVELSNLQRQIIHNEGQLGNLKVASAAAHLQQINPHIRIHTYPVRLSAANAPQMLEPYDLVIDGCDNFATRYLTSDLCVWQKKPNVYGSVQRFEGQCTVLAPHLGGICYRCLVPQPPPPGAVPSCAEAGVLGVLPGLVGLLQATEAIKLLTGIGQPLTGRLLHVDALSMKFREFQLRRDPDCRVCGPQADIFAPVDYEAFCASAACALQQPSRKEIGVAALAAKRLKEPEILILDVREIWELEIASLTGILHIPLGQLPQRWQEIPQARGPIHVICKTGVRSAQACDFLDRQGLTDLVNVRGGMDAWSEEVDASVPLY
jgi:adenylyltransferase/sulfurtransferase